ncbi:MAG: D-alanyl-D-alanine carboxypeptidase family protein [Lachnospiraceae bacterium]|nr:D-alanyl-D-alanine carboxypeptidase family protein [Lachnospiraceae bacterium]
MNMYNKKQRFCGRTIKLIQKLFVCCCLFCLLVQITDTQTLTALAAGKKTSQTADKQAGGGQKTEKEMQIGKKTSASAYIKAKDWPKGPSVDAYGAVLMEAETGTVLYAKNPDTHLYPASITKIMTALLTLENSKLSDTVVYTSEATAPENLPPGYVSIAVRNGEKISVEESLKVLLMYSANDVANGLAIHNSGSIDKFAKLMNERAAQAGAKNTHFTNASGLHQKYHYTTPYDMCMIMRECIKIDKFNEFASQRVHTLKKNNKRETDFSFANKHDMLFPAKSNYYKYCVSGKTGYTDNARNTLITYAEKDGMKLVCCVMKCGKGMQYADTRKLFDYGFDNFSVVDASSKDKRFTLKNAGIFAAEDLPGASPFQISIADESPVVIPSGTSLSKIDTDIEYLKDAKDGSFAKIDYLYQGTVVGNARLKISSTAASEGESFDFDAHKETKDDQKEAEDKNQLQDIWSRTKNIDIRIIIGIAAVVVILVIVAVVLTIRKKDNRIHFNKKRKKWR